MACQLPTLLLPGVALPASCLLEASLHEEGSSSETFEPGGIQAAWRGLEQETREDSSQTSGGRSHLGCPTHSSLQLAPGQV